MNNRDNRSKDGQNASEELKKAENQANIDSATHLEDERTNGTTTTPTPKAVKGSQPDMDGVRQKENGNSGNHGHTVAPDPKNS